MERTNGGLCLGDLRKLHDAGTLRSCAIKQYLSQLDLPSRLEQLDKVFIRRRPRQLQRVTCQRLVSRSITTFRDPLTLRTMIC